MCAHSPEIFYKCELEIFSGTNGPMVRYIFHPSAGHSVFAKNLTCVELFRLEIMESMALYMESAYERLYRWSQGKFTV